MKRTFAIVSLVAALTCTGSAQLSAQNSAPGDWHQLLIPNGDTVYDVANGVVWLADANLPAKILPDKKPADNNFRFGLPLCPPLTVEPTEPCVNASGSMNYTSAVAWVQGMNDANYLGHSDWQLPTAPLNDPDCSSKGPEPYREGFAFGCDMGALGYLYYTALGITAPNSAVPIPPNQVGPFSNFQPNLYWSDSGGGGHACPDPIANFSFASGAHGGGCGGDYADVLPMIRGEVLGMPLPAGSGGLYVNPGAETVYDPQTNITWLANANLAATWLPDSNRGEFDTLGLPLCETAPDTTPCVAQDGSMDYASAQQFIKNMNAYDNGPGNPRGYLGQTNWQLPSLEANVAKCPTYGCAGKLNPLGNLYYNQLIYDDQLGFPAGTPVVAVPDIAVGPFNHLVPFPYWSCLADTIQEPCQSSDSESKNNEPSKNSEWGFSFGTGFLGTERLTADHFVTAYYVVTIPSKPPIPPKCPPGSANCHL